MSVLVDDPTHLYAAVGLAETALVLYDLDTATAQRDVLMAHYPENRAVQRLQRELRAYTRPRFTLTSESGRSASGAGNTGNSDWQIETTFLSAPFTHHWRLALHTFSAQASFDDDTARRLRLHIGAQYRGSVWQIDAAVSHDDQALGAVGIRLQSTWSPR